MPAMSPMRLGVSGIPERWIWAVMRVESNGDVRAVSTAGAMGLMQIMPGTWAGLRARYGLGNDPYDVRDNIMAGAAYLRAMHDRYGNATAMLAAYNAGPGRYDEYLSRGRPLPTETLAYLAKLAAITGNAGDSQLAAAPPSDPFAWRRAALFAVRPGALSTAQTGRRPNGVRRAAGAAYRRPPPSLCWPTRPRLPTACSSRFPGGLHHERLPRALACSLAASRSVGRVQGSVFEGEGSRAR